MSDLLQGVNLVLYDFDDTLCVHHGRGYTVEDEFALDCRIYSNMENPWEDDGKINFHMKAFMHKCSEMEIRQGLMSASPNFKHADAKQKWVLGQYGFNLENFCVASHEEKTRLVCILAKAYGIDKSTIIVVDDRVDVLDSLSNAGVTALSPLEVVNYIEDLRNN